MAIDLPKDATGREIPLDTEVLYTEYGKRLDVDRFTYSVRQTIPDLKWGVVFMDCAYDYCCSFYLTPPEPPDSWETLEADLNNALMDNSNDVECNYFGSSHCTAECPAWNKQCFATVIENILSRIHKLKDDD